MSLEEGIAMIHRAQGLSLRKMDTEVIMRALRTGNLEKKKKRKKHNIIDSVISMENYLWLNNSRVK